MGAGAETVLNVLDAMAARMLPVEIHYLWRPLLADPADDMVLEVAVNASAVRIVTFNSKDFAGAERFGIAVATPAQTLREIEHGHEK